MKYTLLSILILITYAGCSPNSSKKLIIHGTANFVPSNDPWINKYYLDKDKAHLDTAYLQKMFFLNDGDTAFIDSCKVDANGKFTLKTTSADEATVYQIFFGLNRYIILKDRNEIEVTIGERYRSIINTNSAATDSLHKFLLNYLSHQTAAGKEMDSLSSALRKQGISKVKKNIDYIEKATAYKQKFKDIVFAHLNSAKHPGLAVYFTYLLFYELTDDLAEKNISGSYDKSADVNDMKKAASILKGRFSSNQQVQLFVKKFNKNVDLYLVTDQPNKPSFN